MKILALFILFFTFLLNSLAQTNGSRSPLDATNWGMVYDIPATKNVKVKTEIPAGVKTSGLAYFNMACLKQHDKAFEMLGQAVDEGLTTRQTYETDTDLAPLRRDARFQQLLTRLPKTTTSSN
jgi:hypothetical protein